MALSDDRGSHPDARCRIVREASPGVPRYLRRTPLCDGALMVSTVSPHSGIVRHPETLVFDRIAGHPRYARVHAEDDDAALDREHERVAAELAAGRLALEPTRP